MKRTASALLAACAAVSMTGQAVAQDQYVLPAPPPVSAYQGGGYAVQAPMPAPLPMPAPGYSAYGASAPYPYDARNAYPAQAYGQPGLPPSYDIGYTRDDRDGWLKNCRLAYEGAIKKDTGIIGGIVGAIGGGFIGYDQTSGSNTRRIGGTLVGAGVGGLVGLALGALIGGAFEKKKKHECEAYLERYEGQGHLPGPPAGFNYGWQQNGGFGYGYGHGAGAYGWHTVMVPVQVGGGYTYGAPIRTENSYVIEDVVEDVVTVPARRVIHKAAPAPRGKYVPDKRVRYAK